MSSIAINKKILSILVWESFTQILLEFSKFNRINFLKLSALKTLYSLKSCVRSSIVTDNFDTLISV